MLKSDYFNAVAFKARGIPDVFDWCEDDNGVIKDIKKDRKIKSIGVIG